MDIESLTNEVVYRLLSKIEQQKKETVDVKKEYLQSDGNEISIEGYNSVFLDHKIDINKIFKYEFLVICKLSLDEMVSAVNGKSINIKTNAIRQFLLTGKKVYIMENGLEYRAFKEIANTCYYKMFENYKDKMIQFGIEIITPAALEKIYTCKGCSQQHKKNIGEDNTQSTLSDSNYNVGRKLITLDKALKMINETAITLEKNTIITPSAKDIFKENNVDIKYI